MSQLQEDSNRQSLYSVTITATNRCPLNCWHCYNADRNPHDMPVSVLRKLAADLQERGVVMIDLTGGDPLLRYDLEKICASFDDRSCVIVGTSGWGFTADRALALRDNGVFGVGISLDSADEREHDRRRGRSGAFRAAVNAVAHAAKAGLYPYVVAVAVREFLEPDHFYRFMRFAGELGAMEVHLLEPCPTGRIAGMTDLVLDAAERDRIIEYQQAVAERDDLPILSTFAYLEGPDGFRCGAGLTHIYIDGSGELCPCNLVPLSFGNVQTTLLDSLLERMRRYFKQPCPSCVGRVLAPYIPRDNLPTPPEASCTLCERRLPQEHELPAYFLARMSTHMQVSSSDLARAYDEVHDEYDDFWTVEAGKLVREMVE